MKVAAIEIGATAVQLVLGTVGADEEICVLGDYAQDIDLLGTHRPGENLTEEAIESVLRVLRGLRHIVRSQSQLGEVRAIGTSLLASAPNRDQFRAMVVQTIDGPLQVLSHAEEAAYSFLGTHDTPTLQEGEAVVTLESGPEAMAIAVGAEGRLADVCTYNFGDWVLAGKYVDPAKDGPAACLALSEHLDERMKLDRVRELIAGRPATLVASGMHPTALACAALGLDDHERSAVHGSSLDLEAVFEWYQILAHATPAERASLTGVRAARARTVLANVGILMFVMDKLGLERVVISDHGRRHGLLREMLGLERPIG